LFQQNKRDNVKEESEGEEESNGASAPSQSHKDPPKMDVDDDENPF
jgi:hypothetical protein